MFKKPKIAKYFSKEQIIEFLELLEESSDRVEPITETNLCSDLKDNYLVSLAIDSKADFLVTGDNDLLEMNQIGLTAVLNFRDFDRFVKQ